MLVLPFVPQTIVASGSLSLFLLVFCVCCQRREAMTMFVCLVFLCTTQERFGDEERKTCALLYCDDDDDKHRMSRRCGGLSHSMISNEKSEM